MTDAAGRYASSLCATLSTLPAAEAASALERASTIAALVGREPELRRFLASPAFTVEEKNAVVGELARRLGAPTILTNLLAALIEHRRAGDLADIVAAADREYLERQGIAAIELRSADPLTDDDEAALRPTLEELFGPKLRISRAVDPALLGGLIVRRGDTLYDASLKNQLRSLNTHLMEGERHDA